MKVLMAGRGVVPIKVGCGGAELAMYQLARALAIAGHEVTVVADVAEDEFARVPNLEIVQLDSRVQRLASKLPGSFLGWIVQHFAGNIATALRIRRLLRSGRSFDLIHLHAALATLIVSRFASAPLIYTEHDSTPWSCRYRRWHERALRKAIYLAINVPAFHRVDRVATICESLRTDILTRWGVSAQNVMTILNGADFDVFNPDRCGPTPIPERFGFDRYVLFVGKLTPRKAPDLLLRALVDAPGTNCVFAGGGEMRERLEQLTAELDLGDRVAFLGDVAPRDLGPLYVGADLLVIPSVSEGTPLVAFEAMACGTPVLSSRIAGLPELVHDWSTGFLVKPGDVGQLAIAIRFLTVDTESLDRMGQEAQRRVRKRFLWPNVAREYLGLYHSLLRPPDAPLRRPADDRTRVAAAEAVA